MQDKCPEHNFEITKKIIANECDDIKLIKNNPIFSGSISQVYLAIYKNKKVAIKIKHPNIQKNINYWLNTIQFFKNLLNLDLFEIESLKKELIIQLDFKNEYKNILKFKENFKNNNNVIIPDTYFYSENILILEYIPSLKFIDLHNNGKYPSNVLIDSATITYLSILKMTIIDIIHGYAFWQLGFRN